ncbi:MAG: hypothetical protein FJX76_01765 [Armatimonadetes bacterium]|nr:hypothetical protein [Armatimonadota bacterium]
MTTRRIVLLLVVANALIAFGFYRWHAAEPPASEAAAPPQQQIPYKNGGDPFAPEAARMQGRSYLAQATPGRHDDAICYIRVNDKHHEEISSILWGILTMEADPKLHFTRKQVRQLLPLVRRSRDGHFRATRIQDTMMRALTPAQQDYVRHLATLDLEERKAIERKVRFAPKADCPRFQEFQVWRCRLLMLKMLNPKAKVAPDRWYWNPKLKVQPETGDPVIPDFYWALTCMLDTEPSLRPSAKQLWKLYWMTDDVAGAILDYESLIVEYKQFFTPTQRQFLLSKVDILNHVFPP